MELETQFIRDKYSKLILKSTLIPKSVPEISKETNIPLNTVYRRVQILKNAGLLQISEHMKNGIRIRTFHNKRQKYHVLNPRIVLLLDIIKKNPGIGYADIKKLTGYPCGTLSNALSNLERDSRIMVNRSTRRANYFPLHIPLREQIVLINLRKETAKRIILFLIDNQRASFSEIRDFIKKSPSTTSITLTGLIENKIIRRTSGHNVSFDLRDPKTTHHALIRLEPKTTDKLKDRFADVFSHF